VIVLLVEGETETVLKEHLKQFLDERAAAEGQPKVALRAKDIMTLSAERLCRRIALELGDPQVTAVIGLVDVYPNFSSAREAKDFLRQTAGGNPRFYPHAAQYEVEAWILPYWKDICRRVGVQRAAPGQNPEQVNRLRPPSHHLADLYQLARPRKKYVKTIEMAAILRGKDLIIAAEQCPEFKSFLNTLLELGGLKPL
jgi:hypothetical protein